MTEGTYEHVARVLLSGVPKEDRRDFQQYLLNTPAEREYYRAIAENYALMLQRWRRHNNLFYGMDEGL